MVGSRDFTVMSFEVIMLCTLNSRLTFIIIVLGTVNHLTEYEQISHTDNNWLTLNTYGTKNI